jgi:hypothetical protein
LLICVSELEVPSFFYVALCHCVFCCSTFGDNIVISSLTVINSTPEDETTIFPPNVWHQAPTDSTGSSKTSVNLRERLKTPIVITYVVRRVLSAKSDVGCRNFRSEIPNVVCKIGRHAKLSTAVRPTRSIHAASA